MYADQCQYLQDISFDANSAEGKFVNDFSLKNREQNIYGEMNVIMVENKNKKKILRNNFKSNIHIRRQFPYNWQF